MTPATFMPWTTVQCDQSLYDLEWPREVLVRRHHVELEAVAALETPVDRGHADLSAGETWAALPDGFLRPRRSLGEAGGECSAVASFRMPRSRCKLLNHEAGQAAVRGYHGPDGATGAVPRQRAPDCSPKCHAPPRRTAPPRGGSVDGTSGPLASRRHPAA